MAVNKSHIPFIRRSTVSTFENVTILDSVRFVDRIDFQDLSEVDDMLLPSATAGKSTCSEEPPTRDIAAASERTG